MKHYGEGEYKMVDNEGKEYLLIVKREEYSEDPREWDNMSKMVCWHNRYDLGDKHTYADPYEFLSSLILKYNLEDSVVNDAKNGKIENIKITTEDCEEGNVYISNNRFSWFCGERYIWDDICSEIPLNYMQEILEDYAVIVPLYLYDHSGITISTGSFVDPWDSGQVGYAYISKEFAIKNLVEFVLDENGERIKIEHKHDGMPSTWSYKTQPLTEKTWKKGAKEMIDAEVEEYDNYLTGECYRYTLKEKVHIYNENKCPHCGEVIGIEEYDTYNEIDGCGGFYGDCLEDNGILGYISDLEFVD